MSKNRSELNQNMRLLQGLEDFCNLPLPEQRAEHFKKLPDGSFLLSSEENEVFFSTHSDNLAMRGIFSEAHIKNEDKDEWEVTLSPMIGSLTSKEDAIIILTNLLTKDGFINTSDQTEK